METRDWNLCFICQKNTPEPLREPASSVQLRSVPEKLEACYINLINNIFELWECDDLPNLFALDNIFRDSHVGKERRILELMKTNRVVAVSRYIRIHHQKPMKLAYLDPSLCCTELLTDPTVTRQCIIEREPDWFNDIP